ncbi:MAG TPA: putative porin [Bacillota bacterium]|nr:putative porin [Bacillota bacterium]
MNLRLTCKLALITALASVAWAAQAQTSSADALINKLVEKGILTEKEAKDLAAETIQTNQVSASKWKINDAIKQIGIYGDVRFRYEYRSADNAPGSGSSKDDYYRERFRYAVRVGIRGDLFDDFYYGLRVETSTNPRSPWVTFGDDSNPTPFAKNSDGINIGQVYLGWRPADWYEMTLGKMPMPLYVTSMIWDADLNPEGAVEKFKHSFGDVDVFANFGQFLYQDSNPDHGIPSSDTFMLAWQVGANVKLPKDTAFKIAPVLYNYTGVGSSAGLNQTFSGQGFRGLNTNTAAAFNQSGINDLLVFETPAEFNFKVGQYGARLFGDFAYNINGADRARAAARVASLPQAYTDENKAYQVGFGFGNLGLVYGQTSKKNTWEARTYWQHVEQYAADVNLLDSDFFEGRANLEGIYAAIAYSISDSVIGTVRYGYAHRINGNLGTGGNNLDLPVLNPINNYHLVQLDLTWRF